LNIFKVFNKMMLKKIARILLIVIVVLLLAALIVPFLIPVPALTDIRSIEELADADSLFIEVNGLNVHYKIKGSGEPVFILLHGFGASTFSWQLVQEKLALYGGTTVAFDRPAFGLTERPLRWEGRNPYTPEAQADLVIGLMNKLGFEQAILIGNSAGGTVAAYTAILYPGRVQALVLVDAAIYTGGGAPGWVKPLLKTPQMRRLGPLLARNILGRGDDLIQQAWHDPAKITDEVFEAYRKPTHVENWDKALWELTLASRDLNLEERLDELNLPVLVITGDDDRIVPTEESIHLADELPSATLVVIPNCGHVPQEECPEAFLEAIFGAVLKNPIPN
jgi:pimeloyl-ACP methyl ester carboxylesterase